MALCAAQASCEAYDYPVGSSEGQGECGLHFTDFTAAEAAMPLGGEWRCWPRTYAEQSSPDSRGRVVGALDVSAGGWNPTHATDGNVNSCVLGHEYRLY